MNDHQPNTWVSEWINKYINESIEMNTMYYVIYL